MCLSPIPIKDTKYAMTNINRTDLDGKHYYTQINKETIDPYKIHRDSQYMWVPCGHCKQCIAIAQMEMVQRIQMEALNKTIFMGTLTYKNETLPHIVTSQGFDYRYADINDAKQMIRRLREQNKFGIPFTYLIVSERGGKRARPHFHILLLFNNEDIGKTILDKLNFQNTYQWTLFEEWKRKTGGKTKASQYIDLCDYVESWRGRTLRKTYDFHWVDPRKTKGGITDAAFYVLKYMLKNSTHEEKIRQALKLNYDNLPTPEEKQHWWEDDTEDLKTEGEKTWEIIRSKREYSLGFGLGVDYNKIRCRDCVNCTKEDCSKCRKIKPELCNTQIIEYIRECVNRSKIEKNEYAYYYCPEVLNTFPLANYYKKFGFLYTKEDEDYFYNISPERYRARYLTPERPSQSQLNKQIADFERIIKQQELEDIADTFDELLM